MRTEKVPTLVDSKDEAGVMSRKKRRVKQAGDERIKSCAFVIDSSGCALEELPEKLRGAAPDELYEWYEFDCEIEGGIREGKFYVDPWTGEVRRK